MAAVLPGTTMLYLVGLLLLGQLVAAAQFGKVFRRAALNVAISHSSTSTVSIIGGAYDAFLQLNSGWLKVAFMDDMQVIFISKSYKGMKTLERNSRIMVQPGDIIIIYQTNSIDLYKYKGVTADSLQEVIVNDPTEAAVFGVAIQDGSVPRKETAQLGTNSCFQELFYKPSDNVDMEVLGSTVQIDVKIGGKPIVYLTTERSLAVFGGSGTNGKVVLFKKNGAVHETAIHSRLSLPSVEKGDRVVIVATPPVKDLDELLARELTNEFAKKGIDALKDERYSEFAIFAAEIDEPVSYLRDIALFGNKVKLDHALFNTGIFCPTWLFEGNTMIIRNSHSIALHIKKNEKIKDNVIMVMFTSDLVELPGLELGDIVLIITFLSMNDYMHTNLASMRNALSDCINSTELNHKLNGLKLSPSISVMAAIVSDKIGSAKSSMAEPKKEKM